MDARKRKQVCFLTTVFSYVDDACWLIHTSFLDCLWFMKRCYVKISHDSHTEEHDVVKLCKEGSVYFFYFFFLICVLCLFFSSRSVHLISFISDTFLSVEFA